jgi:hypothetical protein
MARAGCTLQETERHFGACASADDKRFHGCGSGSLDLKCERNEASSESLGESGDADEERRHVFGFRHVAELCQEGNGEQTDRPQIFLSTHDDASYEKSTSHYRKDLEGSYDRGEEDEEENFEGDAEADEMCLGLSF